MDASGTAALDDELAGLRRRAYGPDADIASDPSALARLAELESLAGGDAASSRVGAADGGPERGASIDAERDAIPANPMPDATAASRGEGPALAPIRARRRRVPAWAWGLACLFLGGLVGAAATMALQPRPTHSLAATDVQPEGALLAQVNAWGTGGTEFHGYEPLGDLQVWLVRTQPGVHCALVVDSTLIRSEAGVQAAECGPIEVDPVVDVTIGDESSFGAILANPDPALPNGTVVRVVVGADAAELWVHDGSEHGPPDTAE